LTSPLGILYNGIMTPKIGFCCKWLEATDLVGNMQVVTSRPDLNGRTTTVAWLNRQTRSVAEQRLWDIMQHNIQALGNLVETVAQLPSIQHMVRIGSEILPVYTQAQWRYFWQQSDVRNYCEQRLASVGARARALDVRLSFHPGQFVCLASHSPEIVRRSAEEFEYHTDLARWMGYGASWHDQGFKINVHLSGKLGAAGFRQSLGLLSTEARNLITVENDEMGHGLEAVLQVSDVCAVVLDIHHHLIRSCEYIQHTDPRVQQVVDSWRGVRPVLHYSQCREDLLAGHSAHTLPDMPALLAQGFKKQKLRAHSDFLWNDAANRWALSFGDRFDIQVEAKAKNLASCQLAALVASHDTASAPCSR
jgi:UV DNA damage endonuclease